MRDLRMLTRKLLAAVLAVEMILAGVPTEAFAAEAALTADGLTAEDGFEAYDEVTADEEVSDNGSASADEAAPDDDAAPDGIAEDELGMAEGSEGSYSAYLVNKYDTAATLAEKKVSFGGHEWYVIADDSTAANAGTLTLFAVDNLGSSEYNSENLTNYYSRSTIRGAVGALLETDEGLLNVSDMINEIKVTTYKYQSESEVHDETDGRDKLWLLSTPEAKALPVDALTCSGSWWLRSPGVAPAAAGVVHTNIQTEIEESGATVRSTPYGIRPALQLRLSDVEFSSETKAFTPQRYDLKVTLTGGANAASSGGSKSQTVHEGAMETVIYTAKSGYHFPVFTDISSRGITVRRTGDKEVTVSGTPTSHVSLTVPDAVSDGKGGDYGSYLIASDDTDEDLGNKKVYFGGHYWFVIGDDSTSPTAGTLTLFAAESLGTLPFQQSGSNNKYSTSTIRSDISGLLESDENLKKVSGAIMAVALTTYKYQSESVVYDTTDGTDKLWLLSIAEASDLPNEVRKFSGDWWLRSPGYYDNFMSCVADNGEINDFGQGIGKDLEVRPALKMDLSSVFFQTGSKRFLTELPKFKVTLEDGANATPSGGATTQTDLSGAMTTVTYTADRGYRFEAFREITEKGITVKWINKNTVAVSGTPTDDVNVSIPNAVANPEARLTKTPAARDLVYNTKEQELITAGATEEGEILYAVTREDNAPDDSLYTKSVPKGISGGTYYVYYMVKGDEEHRDSAPVKLTVTIERAVYKGVKAVYGVVPCQSLIFIYPVRLPALPEGASYADSCTVVSDTSGLISDATVSANSVLNVNAYQKPDGTTAKLKIAVSGGTNYEDYDVEITITASAKTEAKVSITGGDLDVTYGDTGITLTGEAENPGEGDGTWSWESEDTSVAVIDSEGLITTKKVGSATIKAVYSSDTTTGTGLMILTVGKKDVTITGVSVSDKVYDRTTDAVIASPGTVQGALEGDDVSVAPGEARFADINAGTREVSFTGFGLSGAAAGNYNLTSEPAPTKARITPKHITASVSANNRPYWWNYYGVYLNTQLIGVLGEDDVDYTYVPRERRDEDEIYDDSNAGGSVSDPNVGTGKEVSVTGLKLAGKDKSNYILEQPTGVTVDILKCTWEETVEITKSYIHTDEASDSIDLSDLLPSDEHDVSFTDPVISGDISYSKTPTVSGSILSYVLNKGVGDAEGTITVTAVMRNYEDVTIRINLRQNPLALYEKTAAAQYEVCSEKKLRTGGRSTLVPLFADGSVLSQRVVWSSSDPNVASVTQGGKITGLCAGNTIITARSEERPDLSAACRITVTEAASGITLKKKSYSVGVGETVLVAGDVVPFTSGQQLSWTASNENVRIESSPYETQALITGVKPGKTVVTAAAMDGSGKKAKCTVTVGNPVPDHFTVSGKRGATVVASGKSLAMEVDWGGKALEPVNKKVYWEAAEPDKDDLSEIASITQKGVLYAGPEGVVRVTATSDADDRKTAEKLITVYMPVKKAALNVTSGVVSRKDGANGLQLKVNVTAAYAGERATGPALGTEPAVSWNVADAYKDYLSVSDTGLVTAGNKTGKNIPVTATVTAFNGYTKTLTCKVSVKDENPLRGISISKKKISLGEGNTAILTASLNPVNPDGESGYAWSSSDPAVATVDENGKVTAKKTGKAVITVTAEGSVTAKGKVIHPVAACAVTVNPSVKKIEFTNADKLEKYGLKVGQSYRLKTKFTFSQSDGKGANKGLVWTSTNPNAVSVSKKGVIKARSYGLAMITATSADESSEGDAPSVSIYIQTYSPFKKIILDRSKLTLGTQDGSRYGRVCIAATRPQTVHKVEIKWTPNNANVSLASAGRVRNYDDFRATRVENTAGAESEYLDNPLAEKNYGEPGEPRTVASLSDLAIKAVNPGVVKLKGVTTDGSKKRVSCTVTIRGQVTGLALKPSAGKGGLNNVTVSGGAVSGNTVYTGTMKANSGMKLTPVFEINGVSANAALKADRNRYKTYKKYTDTSVSYRSSDTLVATVDAKGKVTVKSSAPSGSTATIHVQNADGTKSAEYRITVK